jgi:hypothetical protein
MFVQDGAIDEDTLKHKVFQLIKRFLVFVDCLIFKDPKAIRKADLELLENMKALEGNFAFCLLKVVFNVFFLFV